MVWRIYSLATEEGRAKAEAYDWKGKLHGLVGFDRSGKHVVTIHGHEYGKERIREAVEELLN